MRGAIGPEGESWSRKGVLAVVPLLGDAMGEYVGGCCCGELYADP